MYISDCVLKGKIYISLTFSLTPTYLVLLTQFLNAPQALTIVQDFLSRLLTLSRFQKCSTQICKYQNEGSVIEFYLFASLIEIFGGFLLLVIKTLPRIPSGSTELPLLIISFLLREENLCSQSGKSGKYFTNKWESSEIFLSVNCTY